MVIYRDLYPCTFNFHQASHQSTATLENPPALFNWFVFFLKNVVSNKMYMICFTALEPPWPGNVNFRSIPGWTDSNRVHILTHDRSRLGNIFSQMLGTCTAHEHWRNVNTNIPRAERRTEKKDKILELSAHKFPNIFFYCIKLKARTAGWWRWSPSMLVHLLKLQFIKQISSQRSHICGFFTTNGKCVI